MYAGKLCLAPMVRAGELPTRLLALKHGCDLVWSPEIIDKKLIKTERSINTQLKSVDYTLENGTVVFRTVPTLEQGKLVFQMGSADPQLAVQAALKVVQDVDGIDLNAGCPKHFSIHSGMGAALLSTPDLLCSILTQLVEKVGTPHDKPISVKIRLLPERTDTLSLVRRLCTTGVKNITVHCRTREMRNREHPIRDYLLDIYDICHQNDVSLIINGMIKDRSHFNTLRDTLSLPSDVGAMIAEAAETNPTVFHQREPIKQWWDVMNQYIDIAMTYDNNFGNTKYMLSRIIPGKSPMFQYVARCKDYDQLKYVQKCINKEDGTVLEDPSPFLAQNSNKNNSKQKKKKRPLDDTTTNKNKKDEDDGTQPKKLKP